MPELGEAPGRAVLQLFAYHSLHVTGSTTPGSTELSLPRLSYFWLLSFLRADILRLHKIHRMTPSLQKPVGQSTECYQTCPGISTAQAGSRSAMIIPFLPI